MANETGKKLERSEFLKTLGAAGLAGAAALVGANAFADMEKKGKYIFTITNGGNDPNRAILALLMAKLVAEKRWGSVHVWLTLEGAELASRTKAEKIRSPIYHKYGNAFELMNHIRSDGGWFGVCPPCAEYCGATGGEKHDWIEFAGGDWLMKNIADAWVLWM